MFLPRSSNFIDLSNIDIQSFLTGYALSKTLDYALKKITTRIKPKQIYFELRGLKYQILFNYES